MTDTEPRAIAGPNGDANSTNHQNGQVANNGDQAGNAEEEPRARSFVEVIKVIVKRVIIIYFVVQLFRRPSSTDTSQSGGVASPQRTAAINYFNEGNVMDLYVFMSENELFRDFDNPKALVWFKKDLTYGDWEGGPDGDGSFTFTTKFNTTERMKNNGTIYLHTYVIKKEWDGKGAAVGKEKFSGLNVASHTGLLNVYKKIKFTKTQNLLTGESPLTPEEMELAEKKHSALISHWHPNITINLVTDQTHWVQGSVPPPFNEFLQFSINGDYYKPIVYFNSFWNLARDYKPITETTTDLELMITYKPLSLLKWQMLAAHSMRSKYTTSFFQDETSDDDQDDSLKEAILETSPYLLAATFIVSILHSVFELLAFKNDIQFWNNRQSLEGLSVRLVFFNVFQSLIVLLYVLDNDTSTLIKISCLLGLGIDIWKINKVADISLNWENKVWGVLPRVAFKDKGSYVESSTKQYDELAFKYLSWVLFPLLGCYAIYSLIYLHHKGWYSWVLNMIYGFLLTFGFITMTPQLFINYKLKSVAHLPWRMMSYKCLNTFIDDIFAFVIKMPTMYRLGCFRDDIVFFIFLYQRWIYKTDHSRINEFGFSGDMEKDKSQVQEKEEPKSLTDKKED